MSGIGSVDGIDHAEVIGVPGGVWEQLADWQATLAVLAESPGRTQELAGVGELHPGLVEGQWLPVVLLQPGLVIEGVDLGGASLHEQEQDPLGPWGVMRQS